MSTSLPAIVVRTQEQFCRRCGRDPSLLFADLPRRRTLSPVPWPEVAARFERLDSVIDNTGARFAAFYVERFPMVALIAAHFVSLTSFYRVALSRWARLWPLAIEHRFDREHGDLLEVEVTFTTAPVSDTAAGARVLLDVVDGALKTLPRAMGLPDAHVVRHPQPADTDGPLGAAWRCALPASPAHDELDAEQLGALLSTYFGVRPQAQPGWRLTERERELVEHLAEGLSVRELAERHKIGVETVRTHLKRAMGKAGVHSQVELIAAMMPNVARVA